MTFKPTVIRAAPGRDLRWLGRLFLQCEKFSGLLVPSLWNGLATKMRRGFETMNTALKDLAEAES